MYLVRNVFTAKPGKGRELVERFQAAREGLEAMGVRNQRLLTDVAAGFWTVVVESETESLDDYVDAVRRPDRDPRATEALQGYMDLVSGGHREIFRIE